MRDDALSSGAPQGWAVAVAVAARDEEDEIAGCLTALAVSLRHAGMAGGVVVLVNNTTDATARIARETAAAQGLEAAVIETTLPRAAAHAGTARQRAAAAARARLASGGLLLLTDADSRVRPGWVAEMRAGLAQADVVCGRVELPPGAFAGAGPLAAAASAIEGAYADATRRIQSVLDPDPDNPWPHHGCRSGCNIGMTAATHDAIGGLPAPPVAEDRALVEAARAADLRVRLLDGPAVLTSARRQGRAPGGMADALRARETEADPWIDEDYTDPATTLLRAETRGRLRREGAGRWLAGLGLTPAQIAAIAAAPGFGSRWAALVPLVPALAPRRLRLSEARAHLPELTRLADGIETGCALQTEPT